MFPQKKLAHKGLKDQFEMLLVDWQSMVCDGWQISDLSDRIAQVLTQCGLNQKNAILRTAFSGIAWM